MELEKLIVMAKSQLPIKALYLTSRSNKNELCKLLGY